MTSTSPVSSSKGENIDCSLTWVRTLCSRISFFQLWSIRKHSFILWSDANSFWNYACLVSHPSVISWNISSHMSLIFISLNWCNVKIWLLSYQHFHVDHMWVFIIIFVLTYIQHFILWERSLPFTQVECIFRTPPIHTKVIATHISENFKVS